MKKSQNISVWLSIISELAVAGKGQSNAVHRQKKKCNKYDLTSSPQCVLFWAHHNDWSRWFAITSFPLICGPSLSLMSAVAKE
jgi:hypothetical protein